MSQTENDQNVLEQNGQSSLIVEHTSKPLTIHWKKTTVNRDNIIYYTNYEGVFFYDNQPLKMNYIYDCYCREYNGSVTKAHEEKLDVPNLPCETLVEGILAGQIVKLIPKNQELDTWQFYLGESYNDGPESPYNSTGGKALTYTFDFKNLQCTYEHWVHIDKCP